MFRQRNVLAAKRAAELDAAVALARRNAAANLVRDAHAVGALRGSRRNARADYWFAAPGRAADERYSGRAAADAMMLSSGSYAC